MCCGGFAFVVLWVESEALYIIYVNMCSTTGSNTLKKCGGSGRLYRNSSNLLRRLKYLYVSTVVVAAFLSPITKLQSCRAIVQKVSKDIGPFPADSVSILCSSLW